MDTTNPIPQGAPEAQTPMTPSAPGPKNVSLLIIVVLAVGVIALIVWWMDVANRDVVVPTPTPVVVSPDADINAELDAVQPGDADGEFNSIDQDLNSL